MLFDFNVLHGLLIQLCRAVLCRLLCLKRMRKKVFSKLIWRWKYYLVIPSCSYWARVSGGQIHTLKHTQRKAQWVPERALQSSSMKSLSIIYSLAQGTSNEPCLPKWADLKEPATQKHPIFILCCVACETSRFGLEQKFIVTEWKPQDFVLTRG